MTLTEALGLVIDLAAENVLELQQCDDQMFEDRNKQIDAVEIVLSFLKNLENSTNAKIEIIPANRRS